MPRSTANLIGPMARIGHTAIGVVYVAIGLLAVQAALVAGRGGNEGAQGALIAIGAQPFGNVLLALTALGLLGYVAWRFTAAAHDLDNPGDDGAKSYARRSGYFFSGFAYLGLALFAGRAALGQRAARSDHAEESWAHALMQQPWGQWLVAAVGVAIIGVGVGQFYQAVAASFMRQYRIGEMSAAERTWARRLGRFGLSARGVTFVLVGWFFVQAAWQSDSREAGGLGDAFDALAAQPYGPFLLGTVAAGFVAYGLHCFSLARYRIVSV